VATGEVDVWTTGNISTRVNVQITWPQLGYSPLGMSRVVHIAAGDERAVEFHMPLTENQLTNLQNWQLGNGDADGCTYKATIVSTYGTAG
jgi:hypothetical protein